MASVFARPNKFNLSHTNILTCDMGALVPFLVQEVLPGDEFRIKTDAIIRLAPLLAPIFGQVDFYTHYFFVPNRLTWSNWEPFITHGLESGTDSSVPPYLKLTSTEMADTTIVGPGTLMDYLDYDMRDAAGSQGATVADPTNVRQSALPLRVYNRIFNDWYRSEFLQTALPTTTADGLIATSTENFKLQYRCWPRDYMTSALPFTQLGNPVTLPLGALAPVVTGDTAQNVKDWAPLNFAPVISGSYPSGNGSLGYLANTGNTVAMTPGTVSQNSEVAPTNLYADLSSATAATINDIRTAFQLQRILERKARSGNRYVEYLAASFGVRSPDARLQRAEFLGGGKSPVMISEVLQTSEGTQTSPQGQMTGHGFGAARTFAVNKAFTEHGYIMGILSVMPKTFYSQGRKRELSRWSWTDYYQPEFAHLGEQALFKSELLCTSTTAGNDTFDAGAIFGYQPRYEEYRRKLSGVHGDFRKNMSYWHLGREFSSAPALNSDFIKCVPSKRIFAAGDQADRPCWVEMFLDIKAIRPLPKHGAPGMVDH